MAVTEQSVISIFLQSHHMDEPSGRGSSGSGYRTRRAHTKSRYGCTKCKERRIKCDELTPRCSRCNKMDLTCQYRKRQPGPRAPDDYEPTAALLLQLQVPRTSGAGRSESSSHSSASPLSSTSSIPPSQALLALPSQGRWLDSPLRSQAAQMLAATEFELFKHYLEHTCKDLTVDEEDQYTLQIGIPNLACQSKPLMSSVLAIAAVCKCCDITSQPSVSQEERGQVVELLSLAHEYHMESLREIQAAIPSAKHYDHVLANAAMMGMYGSGSHCTRIWLATTAAFGEPPLCDFTPKHSQWISLFRAVRLAYDGLLHNTPRTDDSTQPTPARSPVGPTASSDLRLQYEHKLSYRTEQPRGPTSHVLHPILAATVSSALARLHEKAGEINIIQAGNEEGGRRDSETPAIQGNPDLQACFTALALFSSIVADTFPTEDSRPSTPSHGHFASEVDVDPVGPLAEVSPWLRRYTASITSTIPSRLPRRTIMAFVHKAPARYLSLIEEMIGLIQTDAPDDDDTVWGSPSSMTPEPSMAHQLAMEIFAHWLVLVILLDNVWWIGGIGAWELGGIVSSTKYMRWRMCLWNKDEDWWPASMFEVSRQFDKHRTKGRIPTPFEHH